MAEASVLKFILKDLASVWDGYTPSWYDLLGMQANGELQEKQKLL